MLNRVEVIGRLGRDPEVRYTSGGDQVTTFSVAASEKWKDKAGDTKERTEWFRVVAYGRQAEVAGQYLAKGSMVYIAGSLQTREYKDKQGVDKSITEVKLRELTMLSKKDEHERSEPNVPKQPVHDSAPKATADLDDDIPF